MNEMVLRDICETLKGILEELKGINVNTIPFNVCTDSDGNVKQLIVGSNLAVDNMTINRGGDHND